MASCLNNEELDHDDQQQSGRPIRRMQSSPSATQSAGPTTPRKALSLRPWWTIDRSETIRRDRGLHRRPGPGGRIRGLPGAGCRGPRPRQRALGELTRLPAGDLRPGRGWSGAGRSGGLARTVGRQDGDGLDRTRPAGHSLMWPRRTDICIGTMSMQHNVASSASPSWKE